MSFDLERFFIDIFKPRKGNEVVTIMYDLPHDGIKDNPEWKERREMAERWCKSIGDFGRKLDIKVNHPVTYLATGNNNGNLPEICLVDKEEKNMLDQIKKSTIIISMPEYSATAPLYLIAKELKDLRSGSMPGVAPFMEESGLSADYSKIKEQGEMLTPLFEKSRGAQVTFSTGESCYFDLSSKNIVYPDDGNLCPENAGTDYCLSNLPAGEVCTVPNENHDSQTDGELPVQYGENRIIFEIKHNKIVKIRGNEKKVKELEIFFDHDPARRNIAEFAVGINESARVTGAVLEDEKAGFHWAYGRSDHLGGKVGVSSFFSPENVVHTDIVYARGCPIIASKVDLVLDDGSIKTIIIDGDFIL